MENPEECKIKFLAYFETIDLFSVEKFYMCKSVSRLKIFFENSWKKSSDILLKVRAVTLKLYKYQQLQEGIPSWMNVWTCLENQIELLPNKPNDMFNAT